MLYICQPYCQRKVDTIFKAFKEIYISYMKHGFHITTIHADREFSPLQAMIYKHMPGGARINLTSANEHVPEGLGNRSRTARGDNRTGDDRHGSHKELL